MRSEHIHAIKSWRKGPPRHDCVFVETNPDAPGMAGLDIACVRLFSHVHLMVSSIHVLLYSGFHVLVNRQIQELGCGLLSLMLQMMEYPLLQ